MDNKSKVLLLSIPVVLLILIICLFIFGGPSEQTYQVKFNNDGVVTTQIVKEGEKVSKPTDPIKEHYTFVYWSLEDVKYDFDTPVIKDITLYAQYSTDAYYVTFISDDVTVDTQVVEYNELATSKVLTKEDHVFKYWSLDGERYLFSTPVTKDITLEAVWIHIDDIDTYFTVTFKSFDEEFTQQVAEGTLVVKPNLELESHNFKYWMINDLQFDFDTVITSDIELVAKWEIKRFEVSFDTTGGTTIANKVIEYGSLINVTPPTKPNSVFLYWEFEGEEFSLDTPITKDIQLTAVWSNNQFNVIFSSSGSPVSTQVVNYNGKVTKPADPTHPELEFLYWSYNNEEFDFDTLITSDIVLVAVWGDLYYEVTFDSNGGSSVDSQSVLSSSLVQMPLKPTKSGYEFMYWSIDGEQFNFGNVITSDITLLAVWKEITNDLTYYTVSFNAGGGTSTPSQQVVEGGLVEMPVNPTRDDYDFVCWTYNGYEFDFNTNITSDITLVARWTIHTFTITFDSNGGSRIESQIVEKYKYGTSKTPTLYDHKFVEWQLDGVTYNFRTPVTEDITLTAVWSKIVRFTVTYDTLGGTSVDKQFVEEGLSASKPYNPSLKDNVFAYWLLDGVEYDFSTPITKDITLTAKWVSDKEIVINFDTGGGETVSSQIVNIFDYAIKPETPRREGYLFKCWLLNGEEYLFNDKLEENMVLTAEWIKIPVDVYYTITYVIDGVLEEVTVLENSIISQKNLSTTSTHRFSHWETVDGVKFDFSQRITGDAFLYPVWDERIFYEITYDLDGGEFYNTSHAYMVEHGYRPPSFANPTKAFHSFSYWQLPDGSKYTFNSVTATGNISVKAIWNSVDLNLTFNDREEAYNSYSKSFAVTGTIPQGVTMVYSAPTSYVNVGTYVVTAEAMYEGKCIWTQTATLIITPINLTLSHAGDFSYEYTGEEIVPVVTTTGSGWAYWDNRYPSYRGKFVYTSNTDLTKVGIHTITVTLTGTQNSPDNYILVNDTFEIEIMNARQYNFNYEKVGNEIVVTSLFNSLQTSLNIPNTIDGLPVTTIASSAFKDMKNLEAVILGNNIKTIEEAAFSGCTKLNSITFGNSIEIVGKNAFYGCSALISIDLGSNVKEIQDNAFYGCSKLTDVAYGNKVTLIGHSAFYGCLLLKTITGGASIETIGNSAFYNCRVMTELPFGDSVISIGNSAFRYCYGLTEVSLPNTLTTIGTYAFADCSKIHTLNLPNSLITIGEYAFQLLASLQSVVIPNSVTTLGRNAFYDCNALKTVVLSNSLTVISYQAFDSCDILSSVSFSNTNVLTTISSYAFRNAALTSLSIPHSVTRIDSYAFQNIDELTNVVIPDNVTVFGSYIFANCDGIKTYTLPQNIEVIPSYLFNGCTGLETIVIPRTVKTISSGAFSGCTNVTSVNFLSTNTLEVIADNVFSNLNLLESLVVPISVKTIGNNALASCSSLKSFNIPSSVITLGSGVFSSCTSLTSMTIPSTVTSINSSANSLFRGCTNLQRVVIAAPIKSLYYTFNGCHSLTSVVLPDTITLIDDYAFAYCYKLSSFSIHANVTRINQYAFRDCDSLESIFIPKTVTSIEYYAFRYSDKLNIFAEAETKPSGWNDSWNTGIGTSGDETTGKVIWGYKG